MNIVNLKNQDENEFENFLSWLEEDLNSVNKFILENLAGSISLVTKLSNYIVNSGGKRIRPLLTIACAKLCGYSGTRHILHASVIEFIHTATLLHDDVVDNSKKRRGRKTANYVWDNNVTNGVAFIPTANDTYTLTGTDANGCVGTDQVDVIVNTIPTVDAGPDLSVCYGDSVTLNGSIINSVGAVNHYNIDFGSELLTPNSYIGEANQGGLWNQVSSASGIIYNTNGGGSISYSLTADNLQGNYGSSTIHADLNQDNF